MMYQKMYTTLFNAITEAMRDMAEGEVAAARWRLMEAQRKTEEMLMDGAEDGGAAG